MKAFLSHSSKDKLFVREVVNILGPLQCEIDEHSFEFTYNTQAIRNALKRSDVFVYFLSKASIDSFFIKEEQNAALEARAAGQLRRILIFSIDQTSHTALPDWMRQINISRNARSPKVCAREIQAHLLELAVAEDPGTGLYIGRDKDEAVLRRALAVPPAKTPVFLHIVGHHGIGRRTFLSNSLKSLFPRIFSNPVIVTLSQHEGPEELYRSLYSLHKVATVQQAVSDFHEFSNKPVGGQISDITLILDEMMENGEYVVILDEGGIYDDDGEYQPFVAELYTTCLNYKRPAISFVQTRMMPLGRRTRYTRGFHHYLSPLDKAAISELLALILGDLEIDFTEKHIAGICEHLDGHPFNLQFAAQFIANYGVEALIDDPSDLIEWKNRRAADFLNKIEFNETESDIISILSEYQYVSSSTLSDALEADAVILAKSLRRLQEFCCLERRESYFYIAAPIKDGARRDPRFARSDEWKQRVGSNICNILDDYSDEDQASIPIIQTATLAAAKSKTPPTFLSSLILPSHLLKLARDSYDSGKRGLCMELCEKIYEMRNRLPSDANVETLRLWGLSAIRGDLPEVVQHVFSELSSLSTKVARRTKLFLEGFNYRLRGSLDKAEDCLLQAYRLSQNNLSVNRELAYVYLRQKRFSDAELHARAAYRAAPTNPYIIDIFCETLLGKQSVGISIDPTELQTALDQHKIYGDAPGSSFYLIRHAQNLYRGKNIDEAMNVISRAIERTPTLLVPYFIRAEFRIAQRDLIGAEQDIQSLQGLLTDAGGFSQEDEGRVHELQALVAMERQQYREAFEKIRTSAFLPRHTVRSLYERLSRAVSYDPDHADFELREWAKQPHGRLRP